MKDIKGYEGLYAVTSCGNYKSIAEAARLLNISGGNISEAIKGNRKTAGGYRWRWLL